MKKILIAILLVANVCYPQDKIPFIDYVEVEKLVEENVANNDLEKVIEYLDKIHENDSVYYNTLSDKSYYLLNLKKYKEVVIVTDKVISNGDKNSRLNSYINRGVALTNLEKYNEALKNYNEALKIYPRNYLLWYNKGVVLELQNKLNKAVEAYKMSITLNPDYKKPHLQLGNIFYKQNRLTQALMAYNFYLLLDPDSENSLRVLKSLDYTVKNKNTNKRDESITLHEADDSFEEIDLVLQSKMALNKNYEVGNPINIALTKQNHIMIEQLTDFEGNEGFWEKKYAKLYKWIAKNDLFNEFIYTISYSVENKDFKKIVQRKKKDVIGFLSKFRNKWREILSENTIEFNGKKQEVYFSYNDDYVDGIGKKSNETTVGYWEIYDKNGLLIVKGNFNDKGEKVGEWTWYYDKDKIKETAIYKDGKLEGKNRILHENGKLYIDSNFKDNKLSGEYKYYNDNGALIQKKKFKADELDGNYTSYFQVGEDLLEFLIPYKDGIKEGEAIEYYANGNVYNKVTYVSGKIIGIAKKFYINGKPLSKIAYKDGEMNGIYKTYYSNGQLQEDGQTKDGLFNGPWKLYYSNGVLREKFTYDDGKLIGTYKGYDIDEKLHYEYTYRNGKIIVYKFYNKDGTVLKEQRKKGGEFYYEDYSPKGNKNFEGLYDISGVKKGEWKYYTTNGALKSTGTYIDNKIEGDYYSYYKNGNKSDVTSYKNNLKDGYHVSYHLNGKISMQGWFKNGLKHGEWRHYYIDGNIQSIDFYHKNKLHGIQKNYGVNGKLESLSEMKYGELISESYLDKDEKLFEKVNYISEEKNNNIVLKHFNTKNSIEIAYVNNVKQGPYTSYYFNGSKRVTGSYTNGQQDGVWTWYYENGNKESELPYLYGQPNGKYVAYYKSGKLKSTSYFENGLEEGEDRDYYEDGTLKGITKHKEDKKHGKREFYDVSGKLQLARFYDRGELIGYSYLDRNGKELPMIELPKETGKITAFYDNGKPSIQMEFEKGAIVRDYKMYFYDGSLSQEIVFVGGQYQGTHKEYYPSGKLKETIEYVHGVKHGDEIRYYKNGNKQEIKRYLNGELNGIAQFYNEQGKVVKQKKYVNDKVYSIENF